MKAERFIAVGENIHCTRIYRVGGSFVRPADGGHVIVFRDRGAQRFLRIPEAFTATADWESGKVKHCAAAIWQGNYGAPADREAGVAYLQSLARRQEECGAAYLDINVDEFSTDLEERVQRMKWTVEVVQRVVSIPVSVDSSNTDILRAGLAACDRKRDRPMVNSVSLERIDAVDAAAEFEAAVIASAAGERDLPSTTEQRLQNLERLMEHLGRIRLPLAKVHVDPLVLPVSVDGANALKFLDAVRSVRETYGPEIHIGGGLSNVSFGLPNRKLINQVFAYLALERGADGGIVDPLQINLEAIRKLDVESKAFRLARALLMGEDEFGMNYIAASRDGTL